MLRGNILQAPTGDVRHAVDWRAAANSIRVLGEKIVIEMLPPVNHLGSFVLPEHVGVEYRPDFGVVIAAPIAPVRVRGVLVFPPLPGDIVGVYPEDGVWIENAEAGEYTPRGQIRIYGVFAESAGEPRHCDWWDSVVCTMDQGSYIPYGDKIVIQKDPCVESERGILIPETVRMRNGMATVKAVGPLVVDLEPGARVCYSSEFLLNSGLEIGGSDLAVCDDRAILYVVESALAA